MFAVSACSAGDDRLPLQRPAPAIPIVAPVVPAPKPAPPPPPIPPPPTNGAELFAAQPDWDDPSLLERTCATAAKTAEEAHRRLARPTDSATAPLSPDDLVHWLDSVSTHVDTTLDLAEQLAAAAPPPVADVAAECLGRLGQLRAELFASPHVFRAFATFPDHPRFKVLLGVLRRAGGHLPDGEREALARLTQDVSRLEHELGTEPPLGEVARSTLAELPPFLASRPGDPVRLTRADLDIVSALIGDLGPLAPLRARASEQLAQRRAPVIELLAKRQRLATMLGYPSFAHYSASTTSHHTPEGIQLHLDGLYTKAAPAVVADRAALGDSNIGLDRALVAMRMISRASEGASPVQTVIGPWPFVPIGLATRPEPWWSALSAPMSKPWDQPAPRLIPTLPEPRFPARGLGFARQLQLASFWLAAHSSHEAELSAERLDQLWADSIERFGLTDLYPMAAWPAFSGLITSPGYHQFIDAHLARLAGEGSLARWLAIDTEPTPLPTPE